MGDDDKWGRWQLIIAFISLISAFFLSGQSGTVINSVINSGNGNVDYASQTNNINTDTVFMHKNSDGQLGIRTVSEVICPGNIFHGSCITDGKTSNMELEISDTIGEEVSKFYGNLHWPLNGESHKIVGHIEQGSNKICFNEYSNLDDESVIGEYSWKLRVMVSVAM